MSRRKVVRLKSTVNQHFGVVLLKTGIAHFIRKCYPCTKTSCGKGNPRQKLIKDPSSHLFDSILRVEASEETERKRREE
jgi:hypothetical protein